MSIEKQLEDKIGFIDGAIDRARADLNTDMSGMERDINRICNKIKSLPPQDARTLEDIMQRMISKLEEFAGALYSMKQRLEEKRKD